MPAPTGTFGLWRPEDSESFRQKIPGRYCILIRPKGFRGYYNFELDGAGLAGGKQAGESPADRAGGARRWSRQSDTGEIGWQGGVRGSEEGSVRRGVVEDDDVVQRLATVIGVGQGVRDGLSREGGGLVDRFGEREPCRRRIPDDGKRG